MSRVLITGLATYWGGKLAQLLECDDSCELVVGVDDREPRVELERTEFVRMREDYAPLRRVIDAAEIDTILHTDLIVDSRVASGRTIHENNVIGTMNLLAAAAAEESPVRKVIVKSSSLVYGSARGDPQVFRESSHRSSPPQTRVERTLIEVEEYVRDFAQDNPHVAVTLLRIANVVGEDISTPTLDVLRMSMIPTIAGFDPLIQVIHVDDCIAALAFAFQNDLVGVYNVAANGVIPWSEVRSIMGRPPLLLPPYGTETAAAVLRMARIIDLPPELLSMLRYGRAIDTDPIERQGLEFGYTTVTALEQLSAELRLARVISERGGKFEYQDDVENFIHRHGGPLAHSTD